MLAAALLLLVRALTLRGQPLLVGMSAALTLVAVVEALPAIALMRYSRAMESAIRNPSLASVETALRQHKTFWVVAVTIGMLLTAVQVVQITTGTGPNLRDAMNLSKQERTIADIEAAGEALEAYANQHHAYPRAKSVAELRAQLVPRYAPEMSLKDGWGYELDYEARCDDEGCFDAALISAGSDFLRQHLSSDQKFGYAALSGAETPARGEKRYESDVIWANGRMLQPRPEPVR